MENPPQPNVQENCTCLGTIKKCFKRRKGAINTAPFFIIFILNNGQTNSKFSGLDLLRFLLYQWRELHLDKSRR